MCLIFSRRRFHGGMRGGASAAMRWLVPLAGILALALINRLPAKHRTPCSSHLWTIAGDEFEGFDNETGIQTGQYIVPNYLHFLRMGPKLKEFNFVDTVCVLAAFKRQKPEKLFFHTDHKNFTGKYWEILLRTEGFRDIIEFVPTTLPDEIFGQEFDPVYKLFHAGDVLRIRLLMRFGGIFLDNDCYVVRSLDAYRRYECAISWDEDSPLGTQVLVAHKDARFLKLWLESYRDYYPKLWYYNAGERPTRMVLWARPELVHRVKLLFGTHNLINELYHTVWPGWRNQVVIHLLIRHYARNTLEMGGVNYTFPDEFTEQNIVDFPITFREMAESIFPFEKLRIENRTSF